jgi:Tol biopolymer transport system component
LWPRSSPDGSRLLTYSPTDGSYIWRFDHARLEALPRIDAQHVFVDASWSPDGRSLAGLSTRTSDVSKIDGVFIYSFETKRFEKISDDAATLFSSVQWLPDGKRVLYPYKDRVVLVDLSTKQRRAITPPIAGPFQFVISPDGRALYIRTSRIEGDVWLMTERQGK